jgi:segregation and condensation protein A
MNDKHVPWWRKALNFALGGIRSGFGFFPKPTRAATFESPKAYEQEILEDPQQFSEVKSTMTKHVPNPEPVPEAAKATPEIAAPNVVESDSIPVQTAEPEITLQPEILVKPGIAAESSQPAGQASEADVENGAQEPPVAEVLVELPWIPAPAAQEGQEGEPLAQIAEPVTEPVVEQTDAPAEQQASTKPQKPITPQVAAPAKAEAQPVGEAVSDEKAAAKLVARQKRLDDAAEDSPFSVLVDHVYDGPLDLLLDLIRKQDIDIYDIPIARITAQFLAYVNQLKASDVDVAGEFIYTASLLIHIKSKMLLPRSPAGPDDAAEDPRRELVDRLLEHERFKNAAQMLQQKQMLEAATWTNPGLREFEGGDATEPEIAADTVDLVRIFRDILERARNRPVLDVEEDSVTVGQMIQFLARRLTMEDKPIALRQLLGHSRSERALVAMFLALLELVRLQAVLLRQDCTFSDIFIKKHVGFEQVMNQGLTNALDDWR